jgi:hypothetical protein
MLFDLRGRGRRRMVRVIYLGLAILFGVGFVGFGVGGGFGGTGIFNSLNGNEGSRSASFSSQIDKYKKLTRQQPHNVYAWEQLTLAQLHEAGGEAYVTSAGTVTSKGRELLSQAAQAWTSYIALNPLKPSVELAKLMALKVYGEAALNQPAQAVQALELVVEAEPSSASWYSQLAIYAYKAKNTRTGDLASEKAVALAPALQRTRLKKELAEAKSNPSGEKTYTTTTNGKTYTGKLNSKGVLQGTEVKTAPAGRSSTTRQK